MILVFVLGIAEQCGKFVVDDGYSTRHSLQVEAESLERRVVRDQERRLDLRLEINLSGDQAAEFSFGNAFLTTFGDVPFDIRQLGFDGWQFFAVLSQFPFLYY